MGSKRSGGASTSRRASDSHAERLEPRQLLASTPTPLVANAALLASSSTRVMENLDRGVVAVRSSSTQAFVSWRSLGLDPANMAFNVYRSANGAAAVKLNATPLTGGTNYTDTPPSLAVPNTYHVRPVFNGLELPASGSFTLRANAATEPVVRIPITPPPEGYRTKSIWVGDLDGDGEYDYVVDRLAPFYVDPVTGEENNDIGTGNQFLEAFTSKGVKLWTIDLGPTSRGTYNISPGAATVSMGMWDGVTVQDLNGDGKAEVVLKIANGVQFPDGTTFTTTNNERQFISVLNGLTGNKLAHLEFPPDHAFAGRLSTMLGVGYLDGVKPSIVAWLRNRNPDTSAYGAQRKQFNDIIVAWDWNGGASISEKWKLPLKAGDPAAAGVAGFHQMRIVDVNGDGADDVLPGNYAVNGQTGQIIYKLAGIGHGDRFHVGDFDPDRPGLEGYGIQQNDGKIGQPGAILDYYYDASTGQVLWTNTGTAYDVGRGAAGDVDPSKRGYEVWSFEGMYNGPTHALVDDDSTGGVPWPNLRIWWDGDVGSEELDATVINKYNPVTKTTGRLVTGYRLGATTNENFPGIYGDIMGDWREEAVYMNGSWSELVILTTNVPTTTRLYTLPHNPAYRNSLTVKGYYQSNHVDYYLGHGMTAPAAPNIRYAGAAVAAGPPRAVENLDRGVVAVRSATAQAFVSWRSLGLDPADVTFNVYRSANGGVPVKLNGSPLAGGTNYVDTTANFTQANTYHVRAVVNGVEGPASVASTIAANTPVRQYLSVPLQIPPGGTTPTGEAYTYSAGDTSVGDVDGDGDYEFIVKWDPSNAKDNSQDGYTGNVYVDAYTMQGQRLWRVDLGRNIRAGAHYTQVIVYDFDGDGKAEVAMKTADGTVDGKGIVIGNPAADWRNSAGYILTGPEYLTIFNGLTGAAMATASYVVPRGTVSSWGDGYGNRVDRFLAGVAYLDGERPSLVMARGYYTRAVVVAWDWRNGQLTRRWTFDSTNGAAGSSAVAGQGTHSLSVADVDGDGKDEIVYGAATIDDNGAALGSSGLGHGDALHVSDMNPARPGLEVFQVHEGTGSNGHVGASVRDAATGQVLVSMPVTQNADGTWPDVGRGLAMDVDPRSPGYEFWDSYHPGLYGITGNTVAGNRPSTTNFGVWWDADPLRELLNGTVIDKWNSSNNTTGRALTAYNLAPIDDINGTKATPNLSGDLFGDWREEVVWRAADNSSLYIFTTTIPTAMRLTTLMHDTQYRAAVAWQNVAYNQPPHPSFFLGDGMAMPPAPNVRYAGAENPPPPPAAGPVYAAEQGIWNGGTTIDSNNGGFRGTGFANFPTTGGYLEFFNVNGGANGGNHTLSFRYANGNAAARTGTLMINGVARSVTFNPTGGWTNWQTYTLTASLKPGAANHVRLDSTGQDLGNIDELQVAVVLPPPPAFGAATVNDGHAQRSMVKSLTVSFDTAVTLGTGAITLMRGTTPIAFNVANPSGDGKVYVLTFSGTGIVGGSLADGTYTLKVTAANVTDAHGQQLAGGDRTTTFHRYFGDFDGDRDVDSLDLGKFRNALGVPANYNMMCDANSDGKVDTLDLGQFRARLGVPLTV